MTSTPSTSNQTSRFDQRDMMIARFATLATAIHVFEAFIPSPIPGAKLGLANIVVLIVFMRHGLAAAAWVSGLRLLASGLLLGSLFSPGFFLGLGGAIMTWLALALCQLFPKHLVSPVTLSVCAAVAHVFGQLSVAYVLLIPHPSLWSLAPFLGTLGILTGFANGVIAIHILKRLPKQS